MLLMGLVYKSGITSAALLIWADLVSSWLEGSDDPTASVVVASYAFTLVRPTPLLKGDTKYVDEQNWVRELQDIGVHSKSIDKYIYIYNKRYIYTYIYISYIIYHMIL